MDNAEALPKPEDALAYLINRIIPAQSEDAASNIRRSIESLRQALTAPRLPDNTSDDTPAHIIGGIGNELHNLSCHHQNDEELCDELSGMRDRLWDIQKLLTAAPAPADETCPECGQTGSHREGCPDTYLIGYKPAEQVTKVGAMEVTHDSEGRVSRVDSRMPIFATMEGEEVKRLRERVNELEGYNVGLATESHAFRESLDKIQAIADGYVSEGELPVMVVVQTICKQALAGGSDE